MDLSLEELLDTPITVASLFEDRILLAGNAVAVADRTSWELDGARTLYEVVGDLPGTVVYPTLGGASAVAVRGYANILSVRGLATLLDGVPLNTLSFGTAQYFLANVELAAIDGIELVRGPGSALHGSDAFHGVLSIKTHAPAADQVMVRAAGDSIGGVRAGLMASHEVAPGLRFTVAGGAHVDPGERLGYTYTVPADPATGAPAERQRGARTSSSRTQTAVARAAYRVDPQLAVRSAIYANRFRGDQAPGLGTDLLRERDIGGSEGLFYMATAGVERSFDHDIVGELDSYWWRTEHEFQHAFVGGMDLCQGQDDERAAARVTLKQDRNAWDTRWSVRYEAQRSKVLSTRLDTVEPGACRTTSAQGEQPFEGVDRWVHGVLVDARSTVHERVHLLAGGRASYYSDFGLQLTPRLGVIVQPTKSSSIKALFANAFRAPVGGELTFAGKIQGDPNLEPEVISTYELIYMVSSPRWSLSAGGFLSRWRDGIVIVDRAPEDVTAEFDSDYRNLGRLRAEGVELEATTTGRGFELGAGGSYVRSRDVTGDTEEDFVAFPDLTAHARVGYHWVDHGLRVRLRGQGMFYRAESPNPVARGAGKLPAYLRLDATVRKRFRGAHVDLSVRNALGRENAVPALWGAEDGIPEPGARVMLLVGYDS